jgi:chemotaxis protein CheD
MEQTLQVGPREVIVGSGAWTTSTDPNEVLVTYSLGSCVGLALFDPEANVGGIAHCMLPLSRLGPKPPAPDSALYTDTGTVSVLNEMVRLGARKARMFAWLAGASSLRDDNELFRIGERNYAVARKVLSRNGIPLAGEACGGCQSRTMALYIGSGHAVLRAPEGEQDF